MNMTTLLPLITDKAMTATARECDVMDGVLVVHKEAGWTSHDVVARVRHLLGATKVGHAGTLDPAATGVLPVLIGKGTRIAEYLVPWDKEYRACLRLGETTDTQDATGTVLQRLMADNVTPADVEEAIGRFRGEIQQIPPMYSALKVRGVPLYRSARAGKTITRGIHRRRDDCHGPATGRHARRAGAHGNARRGGAAGRDAKNRRSHRPRDSGGRSETGWRRDVRSRAETAVGAPHSRRRA